MPLETTGLPELKGTSLDRKSLNSEEKVINMSGDFNKREILIPESHPFKDKLLLKKTDSSTRFSQYVEKMCVFTSQKPQISD